MTDAHIPLDCADASDGEDAHSIASGQASGTQGELFSEDQSGAPERQRRGKAKASACASKRQSAAPAKRMTKAARPRRTRGGAGSSSEPVDAERRELFVQRAMELGERAYALAQDNMGLALHEPDEEVRAKQVNIGSRCTAVWIKLYENECEVRSRSAGRA